MIQDLYCDEGMRGVEVLATTPTEDKITRMSAQSAVIEAGRVLIPARAEWLEDFREEILRFPHGNHDDQVDSVSQFLGWQRECSACNVYL